MYFAIAMVKGPSSSLLIIMHRVPGLYYFTCTRYDSGSDDTVYSVHFSKSHWSTSQAEFVIVTNAVTALLESISYKLTQAKLL